jgi:cytochrome c oxidase subunit 1
MGAVFGMFAGFYFWFSKISGNVFKESLGYLHFTLTFIGVNLTFFPMHFLGIAGMPRRIPDFPDIYTDLNSLCTMGSYISIVGSFVFLYVIYTLFTKKI